jgi:IS4 transposase
MFTTIMERFGRQAPLSVMTRLGLEAALPAAWVDELFAHHRGRQYQRTLWFSTVVELMGLVVLGLRPSLHAAARRAEHLPVSLNALYDKVRRVEPGLLRQLVAGSAARLAPLQPPAEPLLAGWRVKVLDGNKLAPSERRLAVMRAQRGAMLPGQSLVVYEPDLGLVTDLLAVADAYTQERLSALPLAQQSAPGEVWVADSNFCTERLLSAWQARGACFVVREHGRHPRVKAYGPWRELGPVPEQGTVREQALHLVNDATWRRIELRLKEPTVSGTTEVVVWSNLPAEVPAAAIMTLYRQRWQIEGLFQRLESVLHSELAGLGHPRAALLGFAVAVIAYNLLAVMQRRVAHAHGVAPTEVSTYHLAVAVRSDFAGLLIALPDWPPTATIPELARQLAALSQQVPLRQVQTSRRGPKHKPPKTFTDHTTASSHHCTARLLAEQKIKRPTS